MNYFFVSHKMACLQERDYRWNLGFHGNRSCARMWDCKIFLSAAFWSYNNNQAGSWSSIPCCENQAEFCVQAMCDDVIKWKHFPRYWPFVRGIHRSPRTKARDAELWCFLWSAPWINGWVNNRDAGDLRRHHYNVIVIRNPWYHVYSVNLYAGRSVLPSVVSSTRFWERRWFCPLIIQ